MSITINKCISDFFAGEIEVRSRLSETELDQVFSTFLATFGLFDVEATFGATKCQLLIIQEFSSLPLNQNRFRNDIFKISNISVVLRQVLRQCSPVQALIRRLRRVVALCAASLPEKLLP